MGQAIVTSHSPHVIDEFEVTQILAIDRDEKHRLSSTAVPTEGIKFKAVRQRKLQLAEAILARGIIVAEGATEVATLIAASRALEAHSLKNAYDPFDLTGISVFEAGAHGESQVGARILRACARAFFAFHDFPKKDWTADQTEKSRAIFGKLPNDLQGSRRYWLPRLRSTRKGGFWRRSRIGPTIRNTMAS